MTAAIMDSSELRDQMQTAEPPRVLDVRTPGEFENAHIAGSYNVPLDLLREHRDEIIKHLDEQVVLVCRSGARAAQAEETLRDAGLGNVHILDGGITAWEGEGFAVNRGASRWDLETPGSARGRLDRSVQCARKPRVSEAEVGRRSRRERPGAGCRVQLVRHGNAAFQAALQPRCGL